MRISRNSNNINRRSFAPTLTDGDFSKKVDSVEKQQEKLPLPMQM
jgi:hypothetical protein